LPAENLEPQTPQRAERARWRAQEQVQERDSDSGSRDKATIEKKGRKNESNEKNVVFELPGNKSMTQALARQEGNEAVRTLRS